MYKLAAVVFALAAILSAATAEAANHPRLTLSVSSFRVLYGSPVTLSGHVVPARAGAHVTIWARRAVASPTRVAIVTTRADGRWRISVRPTIGTSYTARLGRVSSRTLAVGVQPLLRGVVLGNGTIRASVDAGRSFAGSAVQLQQLRRRTWTTIAKQRLDRHSRALFGRLGSSARLRIAISVNQAGDYLLGGMSHPFTYQPQPLTLAPSTFKVLYGSSLTLRGRVAGAGAGRPVTVVAWRFGRSAPTRVGTAETARDGSWRLVVHPIMQTSYRAQAGRVMSPRLTIGVQPLITLRELATGYVEAHIAAGRSLVHRKVKLQRLTGRTWLTVKQKPLNAASNAIFAMSLPTTRVRVALSVNQAGKGLLGSISHVLIYRAP